MQKLSFELAPANIDSTETNSAIILESTAITKHLVKPSLILAEHKLDLIASHKLDLTEYLGQILLVKFLGTFSCQNCQRSSKTSFNQGYCFPCSQKLAACDLCIVKPELCHYDQGTCREPSWGQEHCHRKHALYLAHTTNLKIGLTRDHQIPTRWLDQGAHLAQILGFTANRKLAGLAEVAISKAHGIKDKTNWRALTKSWDLANSLQALQAAKSLLAAKLLQEYANYQVEICAVPKQIQQFCYPRWLLTDTDARQLNWQIQSHNLIKQPELQGQLLGIQGQYLLLHTGPEQITNQEQLKALCKVTALNIRALTGANCQVTVLESSHKQPQPDRQEPNGQTQLN